MIGSARGPGKSAKRRLAMGMLFVAVARWSMDDAPWIVGSKRIVGARLSACKFGDRVDGRHL